MSTTREQIVRTTAELLEAQGYHATGLNQIVAESGAPKGSLYYYFPAGKEELTAEAIGLTGEAIARHIRDSLAETAEPAEAVATFIRALAQRIAASDCRGGSAITIVALETAATSERLNQACRRAYGLWQAAFRAKLVAGGFAPERAEQLATAIIAAVEGGVVLSRTQRSPAPLERVAEELRQHLNATNRQ